MLEATRVARAQGGVLTYRQALDAGLTRAQIRIFVRRGWWYSPARDAYVLRAAVQDDGDDPVSALWAGARAALLSRPGAAICGLTAARLLGFGSAADAADQAPIELLVANRGAKRAVRGVTQVPRRGELDSRDVVEVAGLALTAPTRTLADVALAAACREDAVSLMDAALRRGLVADLAAARSATARRPGRRRVEPWWALADGRAESVLETRARLLLVDHGLRPEELQWEVHDQRGLFVARVDLAYPSRQVAVEADGVKIHGGPPATPPSTRDSRDRSRSATPRYRVDPLFQDRRRQNGLTRLGWRVVRVTWADLRDRPSQVIQEVRETLVAPIPRVAATPVIPGGRGHATFHDHQG
ncbi:hypothetical protein I6A84_44310 [Frankia sp. CNm7]|uniref:DUF559 domain-containing protein n=1 Tax=Frankia nepalensis TaxID=1836974 RepID=A0A937UPB0_9ACTN|nr:type IV toxin-antitoxin system AbiEi family antitoxin domain-containing protein [Frankia nepalensis]MBL7498372.1 hypothetical protein [Frankia nepalensis]MBL7515661.1 hypothetical protein [Frankia nepalensis]MBL7524879.1 hypothetical protein [Frankia nepalensis]MBL7628903.1 hypothetical protein [Frankia nepalensis]